MIFSYRTLFEFLRRLNVDRMKAIFITEQGIFAYNMVGGVLQELPIDDCMESRVEIIAESIDATWEDRLMDCLLKAQV
jgi:hypothetical protein